MYLRSKLAIFIAAALAATGKAWAGDVHLVNAVTKDHNVDYATCVSPSAAFKSKISKGAGKLCALKKIEDENQDEICKVPALGDAVKNQFREACIADVGENGYSVTSTTATFDIYLSTDENLKNVSRGCTGARMSEMFTYFYMNAYTCLKIRRLTLPEQPYLCIADPDNWKEDRRNVKNQFGWACTGAGGKIVPNFIGGRAS